MNKSIIDFYRNFGIVIFVEMEYAFFYETTLFKQTSHFKYLATDLQFKITVKIC